MKNSKRPPGRPRKRRAKKVEHQNIPVVARTVRRYLGEREITLMELDRRSGMAPRYSSQVLNGHVRLTFLHLFRWLDAVEVSPVDFFQDLSEMMKPKHKVVEMQPPDPDELEELVSQVATELLRRGGRVRLRPKANLPEGPEADDSSGDEPERSIG